MKLCKLRDSLYVNTDTITHVSNFTTDGTKMVLHLLGPIHITITKDELGILFTYLSED